jgi:1-acyl-sn-glycerol-3-phosphate acyltransferase
MAIPPPLPRRLVSVTATALAVAALSAVLPLALLCCLMVDLVWPTRFAKTRAFFMLWVLAVFEFSGIFCAAVLWTAGKLLKPPRDAYAAWNMRLTYWWGNGLLRWIANIYSLDIRVTGGDAVRRPGPVLFLMRHSGIIDTLIPPSIISTGLGRPLRYIVKSELLWDPSLDIVGNRFPNVFVRRDGKDTGAQLAAIRQLVSEMKPEEGIILYPEGTRFTARKRARIIEKLRDSGDAVGLARAERLQRVLPPRTGGTLAVLQSAPDADVIMTGNVGFEWAATKRQFWNGRFIGRTIHVNFRRIPAAEVPRGHEEALAWLDKEWTAMDEWVREREDSF